MSVGDISRRQANHGIPVKYPIYFILPLYIFCRNDIQPCIYIVGVNIKFPYRTVAYCLLTVPYFLKMYY